MRVGNISCYLSRAVLSDVPGILRATLLLRLPLVHRPLTAKTILAGLPHSRPSPAKIFLAPPAQHSLPISPSPLFPGPWRGGDGYPRSAGRCTAGIPRGRRRSPGPALPGASRCPWPAGATPPPAARTSTRLAFPHRPGPPAGEPAAGATALV